MPWATALNTGVSAMRSFTTGLEVIGDNIANVNTTAYKKSRADYADNFSNTLAGAGGNGRGALQVGTGTQVADVSTRFDSVEVNSTGRETDLAIRGDGFFQVQDPGDASRQLATRAGNFTLRPDDPANPTSLYLETPFGMRLVGADGSPIALNAATVGGNPLRINGDGTIDYFDNTTNAWTTTGAQVGLLNFHNPNGLTREGNNLFGNFNEAGLIAPGLATPGTGSLGLVAQGVLELSNVDLADEFAKMITTQRAFQANSKVITTADTMMQEIIGLKR